MNYLLSEAEDPIRRALERLVKKDVGSAWIVVDKVGRPDIFVQFARRVKDGALCFDAPSLEIVLETTTPTAGAACAVASLSLLGVAEDERVLIHEEEDKPPSGGVSIWKRLFA